MISGAFNAEYGQAQSGVVNIVTKDGGSKFSGNLQMYAGDYLSDRDTIYPNIDDFNPIAISKYRRQLEWTNS